MAPPGLLAPTVGFAINNYCDISGAIISARRAIGTSDGTGGGGNLDEVFHNFLCPTPPPPPGTTFPDFAPPFSGGQCAERYRVRAVVVNRTAPDGVEVTAVNEATLWGPIRFVTLTFPTQFSWNVQVGYTNSGDINQPLVGPIGGGTFTEGDQIRMTDVSVTPVDGVDDCGDPPMTIPPYGDDYYRNDTDITVNAGGQTFNIPVGVIINNISPTVNFNGELSVPITLDFGGGTTLNFDLDINGDFNYTGGNPAAPPSPNAPEAPPIGGGGGGGGKCNPYEPDDAAPSPDDPPPVSPDPDVPTPDENGRAGIIRGVLVVASESAVPGAETRIYQPGGNPDIYAPRIGHISFAIQVGSTFGWTADIPVKNKRQFIPCPWEGGAVDVKGSPELGWNLSLTPVIILEEAAPVPTP